MSDYTYKDLVDEIQQGVREGRYSAATAKDAMEFLVRNREEILERSREYRRKLQEAKALGEKQYAQFIITAQKEFLGHIIRQGANANKHSAEALKDSIKNADKVINDLTLSHTQDVPGPVNAFLRKVATADAAEIPELLAGMLNEDQFDRMSASRLGGASKGQFLMVKELMKKAGMDEEFSKIDSFELDSETFASYENFMLKDDPEATMFAWADAYVDSGGVAGRIDSLTSQLAGKLNIPETDNQQRALLRDLIEGTFAREVQLAAANEDKRVLSQALKDGADVSAESLQKQDRAAHRLALTRAEIAGITADNYAESARAEAGEDPLGTSGSPQQATVDQFGEDVRQMLALDSLAIRSGVDRDGRPLQRYPSRQDLMSTPLAQMYLAREEIRQGLKNSPSFEEFARRKGMNVLPGQAPTRSQMRRFGAAIRRDKRRAVKPTRTTVEFTVVDQDRAMNMQREGKEPAYVSFLASDEQGRKSYLTLAELERLGNEALSNTEAYPIREIDLDDPAARDLVAGAVPGLAAEMQIVDRGYRSDNEQLAKRFKGSSLLVDVNTGQVVLVGKDRRVMVSITDKENISQLRDFASNPEFASIAGDSARSRKGDAGNALKSFDERFSKNMRVDDVGIALPDGVTMTTQAAKKKIRGELGRRKAGQSMLEVNVIGRDEEGLPTFSVYDIRDMSNFEKVEDSDLSRAAERRARRAKRRAGAPASKSRADYREEALPYDPAAEIAPPPDAAPEPEPEPEPTPEPEPEPKPATPAPALKPEPKKPRISPSPSTPTSGAPKSPASDVTSSEDPLAEDTAGEASFGGSSPGFYRKVFAFDVKPPIDLGSVEGVEGDPSFTAAGPLIERAVGSDADAERVIKNLAGSPTYGAAITGALTRQSPADRQVQRFRRGPGGRLLTLREEGYLPNPFKQAVDQFNLQRALRAYGVDPDEVDSDEVDPDPNEVMRLLMEEQGVGVDSSRNSGKSNAADQT